MRNEIGGQFYQINLDEIVNNDNFNTSNKRFFLVGRMSLDYILQDILKMHPYVKRIWMPAYCCESMLKPILKYNVNISFYPVNLDVKQGITLSIPKCEKDEILYIMHYFGFETLFCNTDNISEAEIVIEDKTQSYLSQVSKYEIDYSYASLRKWTGLSGVSITNKYGNAFLIDDEYDRDEERYRLFVNACNNKQEYLNGVNIRKESFWEAFKGLEKLLEKKEDLEFPVKEDLKMFNKWNLESDKKNRINNAIVLCDNLKEKGFVRLPYFDVKENIVPLYVPIIVEKKWRDKLVNFLIANDIYCPVHWPIGQLNKVAYNLADDLYDQEISLICDQRYSTDDMLRIVDVIEKFFK